MLSKPTILLVAYHFPPENVIGALRPYRFAKYLRAAGYCCHVITAAGQGGDSSADLTVVPDPWLEQSGRSAGWHFERALRKAVLPGAIGLRWARAAVRAGDSFLRKHKTNAAVVLSTYPPVGAHAAGWLLANRIKAPWIADLRDPFPSAQAPQTHWTYRRMEHVTMRCAKAILANTDTARESLAARYPHYAAKLSVLWNGFDPDERVRALPIPSRPFRVLSHVGELYAGRTVIPVIEAMDRLITTGRLKPQTVLLKLVGPAEPGCLQPPKLLQRAIASGWLSLTPEQVPKPEALAIAQTSDSLLLLQPQSSTQVPAKLFEYVQIGRPILAYVLRGSPTERILRDSGITYRALYPDTSREIFDQTILDFFSSPVVINSPSAWFEETFNVQRQISKLIEVIDQTAQVRDR
jgi:hypothetical protein